MNTTTPVEVLATLGYAEPIRDLTIRRIGSGRKTTVLRHGDRDVIRAASRPYLIVECYRPGARRSFAKVSWHLTEDAAHHRLFMMRAWARTALSPLGYAIIRGDRP